MSANDKSIVNIRRMNQNDIDTVLALDRKISVEHSLLNEQDIVASEFGGSLDLNFVAEIDSKVVGFIMSPGIFDDTFFRSMYYSGISYRSCLSR